MVLGKQKQQSVVQPIWARCLVIIPPNQQPFILLCVENCGIPEHITETVAQRLKVEENIPRRHFTLSVTHTHSRLSYQVHWRHFLVNQSLQTIKPGLTGILSS